MTKLRSPRALGLLLLGGWCAHAATHLSRGTGHSLLWCCNVGALLLAAGLLWRRPVLAGTGLLWVALGTPVWLVGLTMGRELLATSLLTHLGALATGLAAGNAALPAGAWKPAFGGLAALHLLSHPAAPPGRSVNLTGEALGAAAHGHLALVALCAGGALVLLPALERGLRAAAQPVARLTASRAASSGSSAGRTPSR